MTTYDNAVRILSLVLTDHHLTARLIDGRVVSNPLEWYPRLFKATPEERNGFELSGGGYGAHWAKLDEDLSAKGIAAGVPSIEYQVVAK